MRLDLSDKSVLLDTFAVRVNDSHLQCTSQTLPTFIKQPGHTKTPKGWQKKGEREKHVLNVQKAK